MFSTYNYRPNNRYYTHKGQILKRTARATSNPVKYSMSDIIGLNHWINLNNYNNDNYPPNPGDNDLININITKLTNIKLLTTNSDNQSYNVSPSQTDNFYQSNSIDFYAITPTGTNSSTYKYLTAASVTLVQKPDNKIYIGYELLSVVLNSSDYGGYSNYIGTQYSYSSPTIMDIYQKYLFNVSTINTGPNIPISDFYIKEINGVTFDYNDQTYIIPLNASINEDIISDSPQYTNLYYRRYIGRQVYIYSWKGDLVFQDFTLATINLNES